MEQLAKNWIGKIEQIFSRLTKVGIILIIFGFIFTLVTRFHFLFYFVPNQVNQSGGFWNYLTGSGEYNWYLADPVGLSLSLLTLLLILIGFVLISWDIRLERKKSERITEEAIASYINRIGIKENQIYQNIIKKLV
jgi:hypothetical protein